MGFSLLETLIVILIMAIIILPIMTIKNIEQNAKHLSFISELEKIKQANNSFREKYHYYAGDFPFAKKFFGTKYNGNGDNKIHYDKNETGEGVETLFAWQHLEKAELYFLRFQFDDNISSPKINQNMPQSKFFDCGFSIVTYQELYNNEAIFNTNTNFIKIAKRNISSSHGVLTAPCISANTLQDIDNKIDDSLPYSGQFYAIKKEDETKDGICICNKKYCSSNKEDCLAQMIF